MFVLSNFPSIACRILHTRSHISGDLPHVCFLVIRHAGYAFLLPNMPCKPVVAKSGCYFSDNQASEYPGQGGAVALLGCHLVEIT